MTEALWWRMARLLVAALIGLLVALTQSGCRASREAPAPTVGPIPTVTGVAEVDAVIRVVLSGDVEAMRGLIRYTQVPCKTDAEAAGTSPECHPDETEGTLVDVLPVDHCGQGPVVRADQIDWTLGTLLQPETSVYAVYGTRNTPFFSPGQPPDEYVVVLSQNLTGQGVLGSELVVADGRVVGVSVACGQGPAALVQNAPLLVPFLVQPPAPTEAATPAGTRTAVPPSWKRDPVLAKAVGLYVLNEDGEPQRIVDFPATNPHWSAHGKSLYFVGAEWGYTGTGVHSVRPDGSELANVLQTRGEDYRFSPDLSTVAYDSFEQPSGWTVRVADLADPASDRKLVDGFLDSLSPDGKRAAYLYQVCEPPYAYWVTGLAGGEPRRAIVVTDSVLVSWLAWLPDGKRIAYGTLIRGEGGVQQPGEVYAIDLDTLGWSYLPELAFVPSKPVFSPDGQWFAYESSEGLMLARWGEQSGKRIAAKGMTPVWSPGSDRIAILGSRTVTLYYLGDGHSRVIDLQSFEPYVRLSLDAAWSPDGSQLAVAVGLGGGHGVCD